MTMTELILSLIAGVATLFGLYERRQRQWLEYQNLKRRERLFVLIGEAENDEFAQLADNDFPTTASGEDDVPEVFRDAFKSED